MPSTVPGARAPPATSWPNPPADAVDGTALEPHRDVLHSSYSPPLALPLLSDMECSRPSPADQAAIACTRNLPSAAPSPSAQAGRDRQRGGLRGRRGQGGGSLARGSRLGLGLNHGTAGPSAAGHTRSHGSSGRRRSKRPTVGTPTCRTPEFNSWRVQWLRPRGRRLRQRLGQRARRLRSVQCPGSFISTRGATARRHPGGNSGHVAPGSVAAHLLQRRLPATGGAGRPPLGPWRYGSRRINSMIRSPRNEPPMTGPPHEPPHHQRHVAL